MLGTHDRDIAELKKRLADVEARLGEAVRAAGDDRKAAREDRGEIDRLRAEVQALGAKVAEEERRRKELEDLRKDLRRSVAREGRVGAIEKQVGLGRPQPGRWLAAGGWRRAVQVLGRNPPNSRRVFSVAVRSSSAGSTPLSRASASRVKTPNAGSFR